MSKIRSRTPCPSCGSVDVAPIVWGLPDEELSASAERGEVALGGCIVTEADPNCECRQCGTRWRLLSTPMSRDEALAMEGFGWDGDLDAMRDES